MNHVFNFFTLKTLEKLKYLNREKDKAIDDKTYIELTHTNSINEIERILNKSLSLNGLSREKIWIYFVNSWSWNKKKEKRVVFNERQNIFIKELVNRSGIFQRKECENKLLTSQQISDDIIALEEMDYVVRIEIKQFYGGNSWFIINPKIIKELKNAKP